MNTNREMQSHGANTTSKPSRIAAATWGEIRTAYASGTGLREMARNMGIPAGTVLARAKREGWTQQIAAAKLIKQPKLARELAKPDAINAITPMQSVAITMAERGQRHVERMAGITEKVVPYVEAMEPGAVLDRIDAVERFDKVARRTFGLKDDDARASGQLHLHLHRGLSPQDGTPEAPAIDV